jgi:cytochrome c oxidase assembly protein subunit 15
MSEVGASEASQDSRWRRGLAPATFRRLAIASAALTAAIIATGAAVRLTGSGLGCPDWPSCYQHRLTAQLSYHPLIEFSNRMVTIVLVIVVGATLVGALARRPRRSDLTWLAGGLVAGVLGQAVLGGIVVYTKLNPYLVMAHFLFSILVLVDAVVLVHRSSRVYDTGSGTLLVPRPVLLLGRGLVVLVAIVLAAGTATTGAGPHAGGSSGQLVAKRLPVALRDMAELHSSVALLLVGVVLSLVVALHAIDVPERVRRTARVFFCVLVAQAAIGYTQYFTHLPALLVELHVIGAVSIAIGTTRFFLGFTHHPLEATPVRSSTPDETQVPEGATERGAADPVTA